MQIKSNLTTLTAILIMVFIMIIGGCSQASPTPVPSPTPAPTPTAKVYTLRAQYAGAGPHFDALFKKYTEKVDKASNGGLKMVWTGTGSIVPDFELLTACGKGIIDMADTVALYHTGAVPVANFIYGFPGQYLDPSDVIRFQKAGFFDIVSGAYGEHGVQLIALMTDTGMPVFSTKALPRLADVKGKKMRVGGALGTIFGKAGAAVVMLPGTEIYTALSTGVIDAVVYGDWGTAGGIGLMDISKFAVVGLVGGRHGSEYVVNQKVWDSLPQDLQEILRLASVEWAYEGFLNSDVQAMEAKATFYQKGGKVITWPKEDIDQITKYTLESMQEFAVKDPKYCGAAYELFKQVAAAR